MYLLYYERGGKEGGSKEVMNQPLMDGGGPLFMSEKKEKIKSKVPISPEGERDLSPPSRRSP